MLNGAIRSTTSGLIEVGESGNPRGPFFVLGFAIEAASFSPNGERLLVVTTDEMLIIDIATRQISWRAALSSVALTSELQR